MKTSYHGLLLNNRIYPLDELKSLCDERINDNDVPVWEKKVNQFILDWLSDDDYIVQNSSGTTGSSKEIHLSKAAMVISAENTCKYFDLKFGHTALLCLPIDYIAGKMMIVRSFVGGLNLYLTEPSSMPDLSQCGKIDFCSMVPLQAFNSLNSVETLRNIKKLLIGGAEIRPELEVILRDLPIEVYATYGMAETCSHVAIRRLSGVNYERYYSALPGVEFDNDERNCLVIKAGYLKEKIITNDVVDLRDSFTFRWIGRYDNLINSGGVKIVPEEVEAVISKSTGLDCAVIGVPDKKLGQKMVLVLERGGSEITPEELKASLLEELPEHMQPREIVFVDQMPRNSSFKVDRRKLVKQLQ